MASKNKARLLSPGSVRLGCATFRSLPERKNNAKRPHVHHGVPEAHPFQTDKSPVREPTRFRRDQSIPKCDPALEAEEQGSYFEKTLGENLTKIAEAARDNLLRSRFR
ncbi:hypothetical protein TNCV_1007271 [Trichonephila clavipes]|nr:hypothetical protein TNCV_1007271 [Trichonephila clavipes]